MPSKGRLLIATSDYPPSVGGMAVYSARYAEGLRDEGWDVTVLARGDGEDSEGLIRADWKGGFFRDPRGASRALEAAKAGEYDLVWAHTWIGWGPALARMKRDGMAARYAITIHGAEVLGPRRRLHYRHLMRRAFSSADLVLGVSGYSASLAKGLAGPGTRVEKVENGVDFDRFSPGDPREDLVEGWGLEGKEVLLTVGGLVERKGQDIVIRALEILKEERPDLVYLIVGGWSLASSFEPRLRALSRELGLEDRVIFAGTVEDDILPEIYRLGDIFVMPGRLVEERGWVEGFGIAYLEAGASNLPSIASPVGGVADAVKDGETGILVPPEDPEAVAKAVKTLLDDPELRRQLGGGGRRYAESLDWKGRAKRVSRLMEETLSSIALPC